MLIIIHKDENNFLFFFAIQLDRCIDYDIDLTFGYKVNSVDQWI